jgi:hypothetical protein
MIAIALANDSPRLVLRLAVVDVTPASGRHRTCALFEPHGTAPREAAEPPRVRDSVRAQPAVAPTGTSAA